MEDVSFDHGRLTYRLHDACNLGSRRECEYKYLVILSMHVQTVLGRKIPIRMGAQK